MDLKLDIETIPTGNPEDIVVKPPANYRKPDAIDKYIAEHRDEQFRKGALSGLTGQIISIAWQVDDEPIDAITGNPGIHEKLLLESFFAMVREAAKDEDGQRLIRHAGIRWITHHAEFDLRFLKQRCWVNDVQPGVVIPADIKHGEWQFDVMKEWAGWKGTVSQDNLYKVLGGEPLENDDVDGSMVYDLWLAGEYHKIRAYNRRDVEKLSYNYARLSGAL